MIISISLRYNAPEMSHLLVQGPISLLCLVCHGLFGPSVDTCHLHPRYLRCVGLWQANERRCIQETVLIAEFVVWSALHFMKEGNCPGFYCCLCWLFVLFRCCPYGFGLGLWSWKLKWNVAGVLACQILALSPVFLNFWKQAPSSHSFFPLLPPPLSKKLVKEEV